MRPRNPRGGYVLISVLLVVVVLSLSAYRFAEAMTAEYVAAVRATEVARAKVYAVSGVHHAMGVMADPNSAANSPYDNADLFSGQPVGADAVRGGGRFAVMNVADNGSGAGESRYAVKYGVADESGKININALIRQDKTGEVLYGVLSKLPNMPDGLADAIVDWVDADDDERASGAESGSYDGYRPKNGPLSSLDELLLVRGMTPDILYGTDRNRNGRADPDEPQDAEFNRGLSEYLTVYGRELNVDSTGAPRVYVNGTDLNQLYKDLTAAVGADIANYVIGYRLYTTSAAGAPATDRTPRVNGTRTDLEDAVATSLKASGSAKRTVKNSMTALYNTQVILPRAQGAPPDAPNVVIACPFNSRESFKQALPMLLDKLTAKSAYELNPRLNVNTAPAEVLTALSGVTADEITNMIAKRESLTPGAPETVTAAWLVTQVDMRPEIFQAVESLITGYTQTYRVQSIGYFARGGPTARVEAVFDVNSGTPRIVFFRDLSDLGPGFSPPR